MSDPLTNPYAPPAEPSPRGDDVAPGTRERSNYQGERRNVVVLALLSLVTLGFYPCLWYVRRARFIDGLDADKKLGNLPSMSVLMYALIVVAPAVAGADPTIIRMIDLGGSVVNLFLAFRIAGILRSDFARSGRIIGIARLGVFFFGCLYLQHVLNEAAKDPGRSARRRLD